WAWSSVMRPPGPGRTGTAVLHQSSPARRTGPPQAPAAPRRAPGRARRRAARGGVGRAGAAPRHAAVRRPTVPACRRAGGSDVYAWPRSVLAVVGLARAAREFLGLADRVGCRGLRDIVALQPEGQPLALRLRQRVVLRQLFKPPALLGRHGVAVGFGLDLFCADLARRDQVRDGAVRRSRRRG